MKALTCAATRRRLDAFHDRELGVSDQIAVAAHLEWCDECAAVLHGMRSVGAALRATMPARAMLAREETAAFAGAVVSRVKAERDVSFLTHVARMFEDMRLVYAGLGGAAALLTCASVLLVTMQFAIDERPDGAAMAAAFLATPGAASPVAVDDEVRTRWTARVRQAQEAAEQDAVFSLSAVVARDGVVRSLPRRRGARRASQEKVRLIEGLLDSLARARFEPAPDGRSLSASTVWLIASTTVRATKTQALDLPLPAAKKGAA